MNYFYKSNFEFLDFNYDFQNEASLIDTCCGEMKRYVGVISRRSRKQQKKKDYSSIFVVCKLMGP